MTMSTTWIDEESPPTQFCYLVMCHTDPQGVLRLVRRIRELSPGADVIVRHDDPQLLTRAEVEAAGAHHLLSDTVVRWGDWSQVEAELELVRFALARTRAGHFVTVSGQCYPVRDLREWEREIVREGADAYLDPMPTQDDDHRYAWQVQDEPGWLPAAGTALLRAVTSLHRRLNPAGPDAYLTPRGGTNTWWLRFRRRAPAPITPVKAATWLTLSRAAARRAMATDAAGTYRAFFQTVRTPDEYYLPSLISADAELRVSVRETAGKRFPEGGASPVWITMDELDRYIYSDAAFVRKIPADVDRAVIERADALARRGYARETH